MNESLAAACGEFEQVLLAGMLRSASFGRTPETSLGDGDEDQSISTGSTDAFAQLITQAVATAVERAGGVGLRENLLAALSRGRS